MPEPEPEEAHPAARLAAAAAARQAKRKPQVKRSVGREAFVAACTQHPERTANILAKMYLHAVPTCERAWPEVRQKAQAMKDAPAEAERQA
eukprot:COSAG04_NODE_15204_length_539_cov_1.627273_2_plen_90_part_01